MIELAIYKIAAAWSDGTSRELKNYGLACETHRDSVTRRGAPSTIEVCDCPRVRRSALSSSMSCSPDAVMRNWHDFTALEDRSKPTELDSGERAAARPSTTRPGDRPVPTGRNTVVSIRKKIKKGKRQLAP